MGDVAETIGIDELHEHTDRYTALAKSGKRIALTEDGEIFAHIEPLSHLTSADRGGSTFERMIAAGHVRQATRRGTRGLPPPLPLEDGGPSMSEVLRQMRDEERY